MDMSYLPDDTQPLYPPLPGQDDRRWLQANVRERALKSAPLRTLPDDSDQRSQTILKVHSGDAVYVLREERYEHWVPCMVGYRVGWVNAKLVGFTLLPRVFQRDPEPVPYDEDEVEEAAPPSADEAAMNAVLDEQMEQAARRANNRDVSRNDLNRIVRYLRGLAGRLGGR